MSELGCFQIHFTTPSVQVGNVIKISFTRCEHKITRVVFLCRSCTENEDHFRSGRQSKPCLEQRYIFILSVCVFRKQHFGVGGDVLQYLTISVFWLPG